LLPVTSAATELFTLSAHQLAHQTRAGTLSVASIAAACNARIAQREPQLQAWAWHEPQQLLRQAQALDAQRGTQPLLGVPVGLKDIFDTADMPTAYGSAIYQGHQPQRDAEVVARLKAAGALIVGKTHTTEFAYAHPAPTVNPHDARRTPGGSSSGSAAAVAAGMVALALGSQTGGSTIRPSAYCGIVGFKPGYGVLPTAGMRPLAPSLDTVGLHARSVRDIGLLFSVLAGAPAQQAAAGEGRIHYFPGPFAAQADADAQRSLRQARAALQAAGFPLAEAPFADDFAALNDAQLLVMAHEANASLQHEQHAYADKLSAPMRALVAQGARSTPAERDAALALGRRWRERVSAHLGPSDVLLTFSAPGEAPLLAAGTGSSVFNRTWTLLGLPAITLPFGRGASGLPLAIQLVAGAGCEASLLAAAAAVEALFAQPGPAISDHQEGDIHAR
jgi:Asp-tRNA(Asn)/Glu-tRNA(Gln) amidotransferase A subunit family amidase